MSNIKLRNAIFANIKSQERTYYNKNKKRNVSKGTLTINDLISGYLSEHEMTDKIMDYSKQLSRYNETLRNYVLIPISKYDSFLKEGLIIRYIGENKKISCACLIIGKDNETLLLRGYYHDESIWQINYKSYLILYYKHDGSRNKINIDSIKDNDVNKSRLNKFNNKSNKEINLMYSQIIKDKLLKDNINDIIKKHKKTSDDINKRIDAIVNSNIDTITNKQKQKMKKYKLFSNEQ